MTLSGQRAVSRRAALLAGGGALALAACNTNKPSTPSSTPTPTAQWVSSAALAGFAEPLDMAALNRKAGLTYGAQRTDPYGPYLPLVLPKNHPIYASKPVDPDAQMLATQSMSTWRSLLAKAAAPFVTYVLDPDTLWSHDKKTLDASLAALLTTLAPPTAGQTWDKTPTLYGQKSWQNTDGKLLTRIGGAPVRRRVAGPRFGVVKLQWSVIKDAGRPSLSVGALLHSPALADGVAYEWSRRVSMIWHDPADSASGLNLYWPDNDQISVQVHDPLHHLPTLQLLGTAPTGRTSHTQDGLTFSTPAAWTKTTNTQDAAGITRWGAGHDYLTLETSAASDPVWFAVKGFQNTQFTLPGDVPVFSEWGYYPEDKAYMCSSYIYAPKSTHTVRFTTTAAQAVNDLRRHAATWKTTA